VELKAERRKPSGEKPCDIELFLASVGFMPAGPRLTATGTVLRVCFFLPPQGGRREEKAWEDRRIHAL
jgi:hypothetical protein